MGKKEHVEQNVKTEVSDLEEWMQNLQAKDGLREVVSLKATNSVCLLATYCKIFKKI